MTIQLPITHIALKRSEIIEKQPTVNIGCTGSVSHGKTTTVYRISGEKTQRHHAEFVKNCTIKLGYANAKIYQSPSTGYICSFGKKDKNIPKVDPETGEPLILVKHMSFVDAPGHENYMANMISGTAVMDSALFLISASDKIFPQVQTDEHLRVLGISGIDNIVVLQNKLDLISSSEAKTSHNSIIDYLKEAFTELPLILPISAQLNQNIDAVYKYIAYKIPEPSREYNTPPFMTVVRSFDINHPGICFEELKGGVVGGSLIKGTLRKGDKVEIRPGHITKTSCIPLIATVESIYSEDVELDIAIPGGLIGVGLTIDSNFSRNDKLVGQVLGFPGFMPDIFRTINVSYRKIPRDKKISKAKPGEEFRIAINSYVLNGTLVEHSNKKELKIKLDSPVCLELQSKIAILRKIDDDYRIYYYGTIVNGEKEAKVILPSSSQYNDICLKNTLRKITIEEDIKTNDFHNTETFEYSNLLTNIKFKNQPNDKFYVEPPEIVFANHRSVFSNFAVCVESFQLRSKEILAHPGMEIQKLIENNPNQLDVETLMIDFVKDMLKKPVSQNERKQLVIRGRYNTGQMENILSQFAEKYVMCPHCLETTTYICKNKRFRQICCLSCQSVTTIQ